MKFLFFLLYMSISLQSFGQSNDTIPFILKKNQLQIQGKNSSNSLLLTDEVLPVKEEDLSKLLCRVVNSICPSIKTGEFKVWIKGEASGRVLGIGTSGEAGIEVSLKCDVSNNTKSKCI